MKRYTLTVAIILAACGEGPVPNDPPVVLAEIPDHDMLFRTDSMFDLDAYFEDPDGDPLAYRVQSTDLMIVSATVAGSMLTLRTERLAGSADVEVMAQDLGTVGASQTFTVTAINQAPIVVDTIPDHNVVIYRDSTISLRPYFTDPDGDALLFAATSEGSADVSVLGSNLTMGGDKPGATFVAVTATDPDDAQIWTAFTLTVTGLSNSWEEDFDSTGALAGWTIEIEETGEVEIRDSTLYILSPDDDFDSWSYARNGGLVAIEKDWEFSTSQRFVAGEDLCPSVEVWTGHNRFSAWAFEMDLWLDEWYLYLRDEEDRGGRYSFVHEGWLDDPPKEGGDPFDFTFSLIADTVTLTIDADTLLHSHAQDMEDWDWDSDPPRGAAGVGFVVQNCVNPGTITWDWAKLVRAGS